VTVRRLVSELRYVPNQLTALRLLLVPVLWALALDGQRLAVGIGLAICFWTDFGDGFVARRLGQTSAWGSDFDSKVDSLIGPSALAWIVLFEPRAFLDNLWVAVAWLAVTYASTLVGLLKFRRMDNLHLQSARIAAVVQYAFIVDVFVAPPYEPILLYLAVGFGILASVESLLLQLTQHHVREGMGSLLLVVRRPAR
jgi:phosphatidylglycerophosphate synthase